MISKQNEKKIDYSLKYIRKITFANATELVDLIQEYKSNMICKILELKQRGIEENEATEVVIHEFLEDKKGIKREISEIFNVIYFKVLLYMSTIGIILGVIGAIITNIIIGFNRFNRFFINKFFKLSLIIVLLSFFIFIIWEFINLIKVKRTLVFFRKTLPINISGVGIFLLCLNAYYTGGTFWEAVLLAIFVLLIPIFSFLFLIKN